MHNTRKRAAGDVTMPSDYDYVCTDYMPGMYGDFH